MFKLGVQVYSVRDAYAEDVKGCLKRIKDIGYEGVELFGALATHPAEFLRDCLKEYGLEVCGFHTGWQEFETEEKAENVISYMKTLGCKNVVVPWMPEKTVAEWEETICAFNKLCARLREEGLVLGFHAHKGEMAVLDNGKCAWDMIGEQTPSDFIMQLDIGNALNGGQDPVELYKRFADKGVTVHYKAFSMEKGYDCVIGEDDIDWNAVLSISKNTPSCAWVIVEKDAQDNFETVTKCYTNLKKMM
jgi:sugar phosphate isomerase/epimerase